MVAAKTWAALFATREWAYKAERGELDRPPQTIEKSFRETLQQHARVMEASRRLEDWQPRQLIPGENLPLTGPPEAYEPRTPESCLAEFLSYWMARNYGHMASCLSKRMMLYPTSAPADIRRTYAERSLRSWEFRSVVEQGAALARLTVSLCYEEGGREEQREMEFIAVCEDQAGEPSAPFEPGTSWWLTVWGF